MPKRPALACIALALAAPGCAQPATPDADIGQVLVAVADCSNATVPGHVDLASLKTAGWEMAAAESSDGEQLELGLPILGKDGSGVLILAGADDGASAGLCAVTGKLDDTSTFGNLTSALGKRFEQVAVDNGAHIYKVGEGFAIAAQSGSQGGQSFRVAVTVTGDK